MNTSIRMFLSAVEPFARLSGMDLDGLSSMAREVVHKKGETIYCEGEEAAGVWVLKSGRVDIFKYRSDGKPMAIEAIVPEDLFGTYCRIGATSCAYPCTAVAAIDSVSVCIPDKVFWNVFQRNGGFVASVCALCSSRLNRMQDLAGRSHEPVQTRILKTLVTLSKDNGPTLRFTKREIAELSSTTTETAIRTLSVFEKKRWISSARGRITVMDRKRIEAFIGSAETAAA